MNAVEDNGAADRLTYQSGDWYGVVGPRVVVVLPPAEKARVAATWALADEGADLDDVLDALVADGLRRLSGFVLVGSDAHETRVVVRGQATVEVVAGGESVVLDGSSARTWVERSLSGVESLVVDVAEVAEGAVEHTIEQGLVRVARLTRGAPAPAAVDAPGAAAADPALVPTEPDVESPPAPFLVVAPSPVDTDDTDDTDDSSAGDDVSEPGAADPDEDAAFAAAPPVAVERSFEDVFDTDPAPAADAERPSDPDGGLWASTPVEPARADAWSSAPAAPSGDPLADPLGDPWDGSSDGPDAQPGADLDDLPTETFAPLGADPADDELDGDDGDHDGETRFSPFDDEDIQLVRPGIPGQPPAPPVTARPVARLLVAGGRSVDVDRAVLLGRAPVARRAGGTEEPLLVVVDSPHQEVSSTHVEIRPGSGADHGTAVVTDLGSTNGTILTQPGLEAEELQPGLSVQLIPGAVVDLGDGVTIQVTRP